MVEVGAGHELVMFGDKVLVGLTTMNESQCKVVRRIAAQTCVCVRVRACLCVCACVCVCVCMSSRASSSGTSRAVCWPEGSPRDKQGEKLILTPLHIQAESVCVLLSARLCVHAVDLKALEKDVLQEPMFSPCQSLAYLEMHVCVLVHVYACVCVCACVCVRVCSCREIERLY